MGVSYNGGTPLSLDGFWKRENPIYKWMMTGGTPISGNLHISYITLDHGDKLLSILDWKYFGLGEREQEPRHQLGMVILSDGFHSKIRPVYTKPLKL